MGKRFSRGTCDGLVRARAYEEGTRQGKGGQPELLHLFVPHGPNKGRQPVRDKPPDSFAADDARLPLRHGLTDDRRSVKASKAAPDDDGES